MKKFSIYFFTAIFFISYYPIKCDWPYPSEDSLSIQQPVINTAVNIIEIA